MSKAQRRLLEYGVALLALAGAVVIRWLAEPIVGPRLPFATLLGAVAITVGVGGLRPTLLVIVLGYVIGRVLFVEPRGTLRFAGPSDWVPLAGYLFSSVAVMLFGLLMRQLHRRERAASAALAELNQRKDRLLATVAHELRTPLAAIRNAAQFLRTPGGSEPDRRGAWDLIDRQLDHLRRFTDDLVDTDSITRNQLELRPGRISLVAVVRGAVEASRPLTESKRQTITVRLPEEGLYLDADPARLEHVFLNLLHNAVKFTPPAGQIEVGAQRDGARAIVSVRDSGVGIGPPAIGQVFEMFYQGDRSQPGLGIGLALVHRLVARHGGTVCARSEGVGQGSEFVVELPLCPDQRPSVSAVTEEPASATKSDPATVG